jgi:hypothetical protein
MADKPDASATQGFVLGAVFDFVMYCNRLPDPMVVGGEYPRDKLIDAFEAWAKFRNIGIDKISLETFRLACTTGLFNR